MQAKKKHIEALSAVCDAIVAELNGTPDHFWQAKASDLDTAERILIAVDALTEQEQKDFQILLGLLSSPFLGLTWMGPLKSFPKLSPEQQQRLLKSWALSRIGKLRQAFHSLRKLSTFHFYGYSKNESNPTWEAIHYPGPPNTSPHSVSDLPLISPKKDEVLHADVVVIGSGAGGGLAAGMLAEAGLEVLIIEKGPYLKEPKINQKESEMVSKMYDRGGSLVTDDGGVTVFAGSCLGGGTSVNWTGSFATPSYILEEWAKEHDLPEILSEEYQKGMQIVQEAISVNVNESPDNAQNNALRTGTAARGMQAKTIARNTAGCAKDDCRNCGWCGYGCRSGTKQSTVKSWLPRAIARGAKIVANSEVMVIATKNGKATGVVATTRLNGKPHSFHVKVKYVVCAAGAIHTPALLLRSGFEHPHLGKHLYLHPTVAVSGRYNHPMRPWEGVMMSCLNDSHAQLNGNYGFRLETPPTHPGMMAMALPWTSARDHKEIFLNGENSGNFIVLTRDRDGGSVDADKNGMAVLKYKLSGFDMAHLMIGVQEAARVHIAAGAEEIIFPNYKMVRYLKSRDGDLDTFLKSAPQWGWKTNQFSLFSAHQMGTCRMGGNASLSPLSPAGEFRGVKNLYIADASAFPASSGANPMISIMALTHHTISGLISSIK